MFRKIYIANLIAIKYGLVDQLEDRLLCKQEVARSNRAQSTLIFILNWVRSFPDIEDMGIIEIPM